MHTSRRPTADLAKLAPGVTLVDVDNDLGITPVQSLLLDQVFGGDGRAYWVDGANRAYTTRLRELAPSDRVFDRIDVARGFTAHQHTLLLDRLGGRLDSRDQPSVVVVTGLNGMYRGTDIENELATQKFIRAIASIARIARVHNVPVVVTQCHDDDFSRPLQRAAKTHLQCRATPCTTVRRHYRRRGDARLPYGRRLDADDTRVLARGPRTPRSDARGDEA